MVVILVAANDLFVSKGVEMLCFRSLASLRMTVKSQDEF